MIIGIGVRDIEGIIVGIIRDGDIIITIFSKFKKVGFKFIEFEGFGVKLTLKLTNGEFKVDNFGVFIINQEVFVSKLLLMGLTKRDNFRVFDSKLLLKIRN